MIDKSKATAPLSIRIDAQLKADIEALAASDFGRSITNYVEMVLRQHVAAKREPRALKGRHPKG